MENQNNNQEKLAFVPVLLVSIVWAGLLISIGTILYYGILESRSPDDLVYVLLPLLLLVGGIFRSWPYVLAVYLNSKQNYKTKHWLRALVYGTMSSVGYGLYASNLYRTGMKQEANDVMWGSPVASAVTKDPKARMKINLSVFVIALVYFIYLFISYVRSSQSFIVFLSGKGGSEALLGIIILILCITRLFFRNRQEKTGLTNPLDKELPIPFWLAVPLVLVIFAVVFIVMAYIMYSLNS